MISCGPQIVHWAHNLEIQEELYSESCIGSKLAKRGLKGIFGEVALKNMLYKYALKQKEVICVHSDTYG